MANLTLTADDRLRVALVENIVKLTAPAGEALEVGDYVRYDANGKWVKGNATNAASIGRGGVCLTKAAANMPVTVLVQGVLSYSDKLQPLAYGAPVYLSDTSGTLADTAGTVSHVVGYVISVWNTNGSSKLLYVRGW
jgi:hypothetical protein